MADISIRSKSRVNEDQRWVAPGGISTLADADTITLYRAGFDLVTAFPNGIIPSGVLLAKYTGGAGTGMFAPYADAGVNGLAVPAGFLLASIPYDRNSASTSNLLAALYWKGEIDEAYLPTNNGVTATAKAVAVFAARFRFR